MHSIRIIGAGSIGSHLANAARTRGWSVTLTDNDPAALERAKDDIYPSRYGAWDEGISLKLSQDATDEPADVVFIGTPPDSHIPLALDALDRVTPKILLIEKPLAGPDLAGCQKLFEATQTKGVFAAVGYNHCLGGNTKLADQMIRAGNLGDIITISSRTREHWQGIFNAHPWLPGPSASYLGFAARGGGATGEHSHAINMWQHFSHVAGAGRVARVSARLDHVRADGTDYDQSAFITLESQEGLIGDVIQDVVTAPTEKSARLQGTKGFIEWSVNARPGEDRVAVGHLDGPIQETFIPKTRPGEFIAEIDHLAEVMNGDTTDSPIALSRGLDTMMVIAATFKSDATGRPVTIDWSKGYTPDALN